MNHLTDADITDYCHRLLDADRVPRVEEHILICPECQMAVSRLQAVLKIAGTEREERKKE